MKNTKRLPKILTGKSQLGPYPMEKLKQVDNPTTKIVGTIERFDERNTGFQKAYRGDYGPKFQSPPYGSRTLIDRAIINYYANRMRVMENERITPVYPIPEDHGILSRHIKSFGYFMGADIIGIS
jgi:hypothetical protein